MQPVNRSPGGVVALVFACLIAIGAVLAVLHFRKTPGDRPETQPTQVPGHPAASAERPLRPGEARSEKADTAPARAAAEAFARFDEWTTRYLVEIDPAARSGLVADGVAAAEARRRALYALIAADPRAALRAAVPWGARRALPAEVSQWLEKPVSGIGDLSVVAALPVDGAEPGSVRPVRREIAIDGQSFDTYVVGRGAQMASRRDIAIHGIAVGDRLAWSGSPVRLLAAGEPAPEGRAVVELCAISGQPSGPDARSGGEPLFAADIGDRVIYLCSAGHIAALEESLEVAEAGGADAGAAGVATAPVGGDRSVLIIRARFADQVSGYEPQAEPAVMEMVAEARRFFVENSGNRFAVHATVTPVYALPQTSSWYAANDASGYAKNVLDAARQVAANPSAFAGNAGLPAFNYLDHDLEVVRYTGGPGNFAGQAYVGARGVWLKTGSAGVLAHEIAHNLGLWHANAWIPDDPRTIVGPGRNGEYGDVFDTMGLNSGAHWHFNAYEKRQLGWIEPASIAAVPGAGGLFRLEAHDLGASPGAAGLRGLRIRRDFDRDLWVEFRQHPDWASNRWLSNGVGLRWDPWLSSGGGTQLLDTTPLTADGYTDAALVLGRTFSDAVADIHVTPVARASGATPAMDVDVRVGPFPGNRAPVVTLTASTAAADVGEAVSFTVDATDPDGDALSHAWEFEDRSVMPDAAMVTKVFAAAGHERARVVVSDRKGLATSASIVITVGSPSGFVLRGRALDAAGAPVSDVRIHNGLSPHSSGHRESHTDSEGRYALTDLPAGSWTIEAERPGWMFAPRRFLNPVIVPGDVAAADFVGEFAGYTLGGFVLAADGSPVAHAVVSAGGRTEPTDASGAFAFHGLPAGAVNVSATRGSRRFGDARIEINHAGVSGVILSEQTWRLAGEVAGVAAGASVTITDGARSTTAAPQTGGLVFALDRVPAGLRHLVAISSEGSISPENFVSPLLVDGDRNDLVFARDATPGWFITGRVIEDGEGVPGVTIATSAGATTTDADGRYFLTPVPAGNHFVTATAAGMAFEPATRQVAVLNSSVGGIDFVAESANAPPHFTLAATLAGDPGEPFVRLSALASDDGGDEHLRYSWSVLSGPSLAVAFRVNGTHGAAKTTAVFPSVGEFRIRVTAVDARGASATSDVRVVVPQVVSALAIEPPAHPVWLGGTAQFELRCLDQFGNGMPAPDSVAWTVSGGGSVDARGLFHAASVGESFEAHAHVEGLVAARKFSVGYPPGPGMGITREVWTGISGWSVAHLRNSAAYPSKPNHVGILAASFESPPGLEHDYGQRLRGYFVPPVSGDYVFFIASNNASELWISPDSDPARRVLVAKVGSSTAPRNWEAGPDQRSPAIALVEGREVYIEALHKEDTADDHLAVGALLPGGVFERPIPSHRLQPWGVAVYGPPTIASAATVSPAVVGASMSARVDVLAASAAGANNLVYRWTVTGAAPGAVAFLPNGSNAARMATARFSRAGTYLLRVIVTDPAGQSADSTVSVVVDETFTSWRHRHFTDAELDSPALEARRWGADADPDGDGVPNLLEYAFALDPLTPSREGLPRPGMITVDGVEYLSITFHRNPEATDVTYTPQASSDLQTWESGMQQVGAPASDGSVTYRDARPAGDFDRRFMRVQVTGP